MVVFIVATAEEYGKLISSSKPTVAIFTADWAEQCKQVLDIATDLSAQPAYADVQFISVPAEELSEISMKHQIEAVPTVVFFRAGSALDRVDGVQIAAFTSKCEKLAGVATSEKGKLEERLKALISRHPVMIFMKGDRSAPRCGFSKQLIAIVNETGVSYDTFDILTDEDVRQGLKTFSDWPTYPQVYVKGELIGGLDIVKELLASGELKATLAG
ncbi:glutaredoxin 3 [Phlebotomus argentipes]|uniref:glutaredoxin 3 n=1 Tax=Phlebotomus argentipes TaxID=94469 RepID=UPI0028935DE1|nr:glutaredoxin 3 [Phlebotomus argentipes]